MNNLFLLADDTTGGGNNSSSIIILVVLAVLMIGMMLLSIIPQKKRQKKAQEMMNSIKVGTKIRTIGGFVGVIKAIDNQQNVFVLDISSNLDGSTLVTIDKGAVYNVIATPDGVPVCNATAEAAQQQVAEDDKVADEAAGEKKSRKRGRKHREEVFEDHAETTEGDVSYDGTSENIEIDAESSDPDTESNTTGIDSDEDLKF